MNHNLMETYLDNKRRLAALLAAATTTTPAPPSSFPASSPTAAKHPLFGPIPRHLLHKYLCPTPSNPNPKPILDYGRKHMPSTPLPAPPFSSSNDQQPVHMPPNQSPSFHGLICDIAPLIVTSNHDTQPPPLPPPSFGYEHEPRSPILEECLRNFRCPVKNKSPVGEEHARMSRQKVSFFGKTQIGNDSVTDTIEEESPANVATDIDVEPHSQDDDINGHGGGDPDIVLIQDDMPLLSSNSDQKMAEAANAAVGDVGGASFRSDIVDSNRVHNVVIIEDDDQPSLVELSILNSNAVQEMVEADAIDDSSSGKRGFTDNCDTSTCILLTEDEPPSLEELSEWSALHGAGVCSCCVGAKSYESLGNPNAYHNSDVDNCYGTCTFEGVGVETFGSPSMLKANKVSVNCVSKKRNYGVVEPGSCVYSTRSKTKRRMDSSRLLSELKCLAASSPCPLDVVPFFTQFRAENWSYGDDSQLSSSNANSNKSLFAL